ncbi:MAG: hypothetical protein GY725_23685 [bacterium]|nr:hypothetical protein [bacterium]
MKALLSLTRSLFETIGQPGASTSDSELALGELQSLTAADRSFSETLSTLELTAEDVPVLSTPAWVAHLGWRRGVGAARPSEEFLDALYDLSSDAVTRLHLLEQILLASPSDAETSAADLPARVDGWLDRRIEVLVSVGDLGREHREDAGLDARVDASFQLAALLLQVATPGAMAGLRSLLQRDWLGTESLRRNVAALIDASLATESDRHEWYRRTGLEPPS